MKRKFISAMLFGALLIAPATTFVGCADYDDDIENLQGQITNNATTLDQLTKEKIQNVETEIESLKAANKQLQEALDKAKSEGTDADAATLAAAQKLVEDAQAQLQAALDAVNGDITGINGKITDINGQIIDLDAKYTTANGQIIDLNGKISDLDARLLAQDGRLKSVESLLAADGKLTLAINDAQALAEKAYNLAEQTAATAEANKQAIKDAADNLKSIKESLEGQINTLSDKVNDLSKKLADQNADITAQINSLKSQLNDANEGISANGDKIKANKQKIDEIVGQLTELQNQINANKSKVETLESNYLSKVNELVAGQNGLKTSIEGLKSANETINQRLESAEGRLDTIEDLIASLAKSSDVTSSIDQLRQEIEAKIGKLNEEGKDDTVASLIAGINTSITSIQGDITRIDGEITRIDGLIDVLFTDLSNLVTSLEIQDNTFDAVWGKVTAANVGNFAKDDTKRLVCFPEKSNRKATRAFDEYTVEDVSGDMYLTINPTDIDFDNLKVDLRNSLDEKSTAYTLTRAEVAEGHLITRATKAQNGLYHFRYKCSNTKPEAEPQASNVAYAATVTFPWTKKGEKKPSERSVYSKYDITFRPTRATAVASDGFGIGFDSEVNTFNQTSVVPQPTWNSIETKGVVRPVANKENPDAAFLVKLLLNTDHKVYAKYIKCTNALNSNGAYDANAVADINKQSSAFDKVIYATDKATDKDDPDFKSLTIDVNKYNGYTVSFDYYIWNYDGSVLKRTYTLNFTKPLIADDNAHAEVTPEAKTEQTAFADDFANTLCMDAKRSIWTGKATKFNVLPISGEDAGSVKSVTLTSADKQTNYVSCNYNNGTKVALNHQNEIKNLKFVYDPTTIDLNKTYKFKVVFYDANDNEVNTVNVSYTMKAPTGLNAKIVRGTNLFNNDVAIFWAMSEHGVDQSGNPIVTAAYGDFSSIIAHVNENLDGNNSKIWFKNTDVYSQQNNNLAYRPESGLTSYNKFVVPFAAVDNNHIYNISAGVEYFGCNNLWQAAGGDGNFKVKFASRVLNAKGFNASATIAYGASTNINNGSINAYDPSKGFSNGQGTKMNFLGSSIDAQIKDVKVYFKNEGDMPLFSKAYLADAAGHMVEDMLTNTVTTPNNAAKADHIVLETKDKASVQLGQTTITLQLVVTDVFGHSSKKDQYNITIKIDPNLTPSHINHRR